MIWLKEKNMGGETSGGFVPEQNESNVPAESIEAGELVIYQVPQTGENDLYRVKSVSGDQATIHPVTDENNLTLVYQSILRKLPKVEAKE
jgi:hypothetical protein